MASGDPGDGTGSGPAWQVVVLSWNRRDDTLTCLDSLSRIDRTDVGIICVDNGSTDGSVDEVRERFPHVTLIEAGTNLGFCGGNNLGLRYALDRGASWIVLVNNDATVAKDVIDGFERAIAERPNAGILAGKVFFADHSTMLWFAGQRVSTVLGYSGRPRGYGRQDGPRYQSVVRTQRAVGALMGVSRRAIERVGLLDEDLFAYAEDVDLALRVRDAGLEVVFAPAARAWHSVSASTGGEAATTHAVYYGVRNTIVVLERNRPLGSLGNALRRGSVLTTYLLLALTRDDCRAALAAVREGFRDACAGNLGPRADQRGTRSGAPASSLR